MENKLLSMCCVVLGLGLAVSAMAMDHSKMTGEMDHSKMDHSKMDGAMEHSVRMGDMIHESTVDGYKISYHLIDNMAQMAKMKDMKGHDMSQMKSHHLMAYIVDPAGKPVADGKVGYKVTGPGGTDQTAMTMGMTGGFGADVDLKAKGTYTIKTKAVAGEAKLLDEFSYEVK
jgi:hypothetical protein